MADKPNCYQCIYRGEVPGDAHSCCNHPIARKTPSGELLALLKGHMASIMGSGADALGIKANAHGVRRGWFNWPYNFDPTWLQHCDGFTPREAKPTAVETRIE